MARSCYGPAALALTLAWIAHAQPSAPTALSAQPGDGQAELTWADPSDNTISAYSVRYATDEAALSDSPSPEWNVIAGSGTTTVRHVVPNLANGTRYYFQIRAAAGDRSSGPSNTATTQLATSPAAAVTIGDANLRQQLETVMGKTAGATITQLDMAQLIHFSAWNARIAAVAGLDHAVNLESLDLSDNRISNVTPLEPLTALAEVTLDNNRISNIAALGQLRSLSYLGLSNNSISDVTALAHLRSLRELRLGDNSISNITALVRLTALKDLHLNDNNIADVTALVYLAALQELNLDGNRISDVTPLGRLTKLEQLWLNSNAISDVAALGDLTKLKGLHLDDNRISDVTALRRLTELSDLSLGANSISDLTALGRLTELQGLYLHDNRISDVTPLGQLKDLFELSLANNHISDITALASMRSLRLLWLDGNAISDMSTLARLTLLEVLNLDNNGIADLTSLGGSATSRLLRLHLNDNDISDIAALGNLAALEFLYLNNNAISNITTLGKLAELFWLELDGNDVSDVSALAGLRALAYVSLDNNAVSDVTALEGMKELSALSLRSNGISDVTSFGQLTLLASGWPRTTLDLGDNSISDVTALGSLTTLRDLRLGGNDISNVTALGRLTALDTLHLGDNDIADVTALGDLTHLFQLTLNDNRIADVTALEDLTSLQMLDLARNNISDATVLGRLQSLRRLRLDGNRIADAGALLGGHVGEGDVVGLRGNPLSAASIERHVPALRDAGAVVLAGQAVPLFPSAADATGRQGFVRVLNRSGTAGDVFINAVDDAGVKVGPVRLAVGAGAAAHFNSDDLEGGNAMKGLAEGVGAPTAGAWRLELLSSLDIEVLAYIRTRDGFLTSIHDLLPRDERTGALQAAIVNPGRNGAQRSVLRLLNAGTRAESAFVRAVDDRGSARQTRIVVSTGAMALTAAELERYRSGVDGIGRGAGKRRLAIEVPWWVDAMSLLASPNEHLTNLSTAPAAAEDGVWRVPLFPASSDTGEREGFVRVANYGASGEAAIVAVDDGGVRTGPVTLRLGARQTTHFNSQDLEQGNAAKGLPAGVGTPTQGDWRLQITSAADIRVTSFVRSAGGFMTSMHDVAPADGNVHRVVFFNPAGNTQQQSLLRLVNEGDTAATVTVTGVDDAARPGGEVRTTIPAGQSMSLTATQLERGDDGLSGRLGDGAGKWRLRVESNRPLSVMSLLESSSGHLTNLSTAGTGV